MGWRMICIVASGSLCFLHHASSQPCHHTMVAFFFALQVCREIFFYDCTLCPGKTCYLPIAVSQTTLTETFSMLTIWPIVIFCLYSQRHFSYTHTKPFLKLFSTLFPWICRAGAKRNYYRDPNHLREYPLMAGTRKYTSPRRK